MKRAFLIITSVILLLITGNVSAQSIIHPNKFGFGYEFGYASIKGISLIGHSLYVSTGKFDFFLGYSDLETTPNSIHEGSVGMNYTIIKPNAWYYPTFHAGFVSGNTSYMSAGISFAAIMTQTSSLKILPELGAIYALSFSDVPVNSYTDNLSFFGNLNFAIGDDSFPLYFVAVPGFEVVSGETVFDLTLGVSVVP